MQPPVRQSSKLVAKDEVQPYGLTPEFERLVAVLCCSKPKFWSKVGSEADPRAFRDASVRLMLEACRTIALNTGKGPNSPVLVLQRLRALQEEGQVKRQDVKAVKEIILALEDEAESVNQEQVSAELARVVRERLNRVALDQALDAYGKRKDMASIIQLFRKAERVGQVETSVGARLNPVGLSDSVNVDRTTQKLMTGIEDLDAVLPGLPRGSYTVVVGDTGDGKSMVLSHIYANAIAQRLNCAYLTLELPENMVMARSAANLTGVPINEILDTDDGSEEAARRLGVLAEQGRLGLGVVKYMTADLATVLDMEAWVEAEEQQLETSIDVVVVDYAQLLRDPTKKARNEEVASITKALRAFAMSKGKWVVSANQVNAAGADKRKTKQIGTEHMAGSREVGNATDVVLGLKLDEEGEMLTIRVAKNRYGQRGMVAGPFITDFGYGRVSPVVREGWPF